MDPEKTVATKIGERIKSRREEFKMTASALAEQIGVSTTQLLRYEKGINLPTAKHIVAAAHALNTSADWLLGMTTDHVEVLTDTERELLRLFRAKPEERHQAVLEIVRLTQ